MLEVKNLCAGYKGREIIHDISLEAERGHFFCIIGPNGCGKTTLLKSIARIIPCKGDILLDGLSLKGLKRRALAQKISFLAQSSELYFPYTVYDTVALGCYASAGPFPAANLKKEEKAKIESVLATLNLQDIQDSLITELSGGQVQRVYLARSLVQDPEVILLDEPTNHLDLKYQTELLQFLVEWAASKNRIVIGVLHDLNLAATYGQRIALINDGRLCALGPANEVLNNKVIEEIYGMNVKKFMTESYKRWGE
ncbi:MAG: ABC transporter ATP-binding protein [Spirochaetaceae bacterium]|jgi:iron complex transport system ATP-binding protein|nr:ABC transporter ATP-binding protein [Spirochaetaceae bacterium]